MRPYNTGNEKLDDLIDELVNAAGDGSQEDLIKELIVSSVKLYRDHAERGDVKLINAAVKELRYSTLIFSKYRDTPKVTVFGSARVDENDPNYRLALEFAREMVDTRGWMVVTGAGPGIMQAANEGAGADHSFGVNIRLPFEDSANPYVDAERTINFKYFFTRKVGFIKESHAFALFPGGFGTMDETFELLTLVQTGKSDLHPIVLLEADDTGYWETFNEFVREDLLGNGLIAPSDLALYKTTSSARDAADEISHFYANYRSQRYVDGRLVLRMRLAPTASQLQDLNERFADIVAKGEIETIEATPVEIRDEDSLDDARVALFFNRRSYGRLRQFVDALNALVEPQPVVHPPPTFNV
jgi:uncharacterized protein (TIGR00730 family)